MGKIFKCCVCDVELEGIDSSRTTTNPLAYKCSICKDIFCYDCLMTHE